MSKEVVQTALHKHSTLFQFFQMAGILLIFGAIFSIVGYIVIVGTRLFLFPTKVKFGHCFWVGLCACWLFFNPAWYVTGHFPGAPVQEYDYQFVEPNKVSYVKPPEKGNTVEWHLVVLPNGSIRNDPLYLIGKVDNKNKEFVISQQQDKVVSADYKGGELIAVKDQLGSILKHKEIISQDAKEYVWYGTIFVIFMGVLFYLDSLRIAFVKE